MIGHLARRARHAQRTRLSLELDAIMDDQRNRVISCLNRSAQRVQEARDAQIGGDLVRSQDYVGTFTAGTLHLGAGDTLHVESRY